MLSPLTRFSIAVCLLALTSLTLTAYAQHPQDVTTWHNDNNRTGWQSHETNLVPSNVTQSTFGLLWQWRVSGRTYAQPLAVAGVQTQFTGCQPCDLVIVATEEDMLYAFNAASNSQTPVWSKDLAAYVGGTPVKCDALPTGVSYDPCSSGLLGSRVGVTGTPVIDMVTNPYTLYVVGAVYFAASTSISFYLFAVDIRTENVLDVSLISGSVNGHSPGGGSGKCTSDFPSQGQVSFDFNHIQRSAPLLLNGKVYVAFAPGGGNEIRNGWMFGYSFANGTTLAQTAIFNSTPFGTGGGIWQAGAGPASDGTYIYAATANGTLFDAVLQSIPYDVGDALLKFDPSTLAVLDYYAPSNALSYHPLPNSPYGLCLNDEDFGSGGVLLPPDFTYTGTPGGCTSGCSVVINADKQSQLYVANRGNLGKFNASGGNNIATVLTPCQGTNSCQPLVPGQGYWGSPAYWEYTSGNTTNYMLYYTPTTEDTDPGVPPLAMNAYQLLTSGTSGPISKTPTATTGNLFCQKSPTPSVSSNQTTASSGIVWVIEHQNKNNQSGNQTPDCADMTSLPAALHAYNPTTLAELYHSNGTDGVVQTPIGDSTSFSTPTIFQGHAYMGTRTEVDVFGLCSSLPSGKCQP